MAGFLARFAGEPFTPGDFVDTEGNVLGRHGGLARYTVGQRKGLGAFGRPMYVVSLDRGAQPRRGGAGGQPVPRRMHGVRRELIPWDAPPGPLRCRAKIRYRAPAASCTVTPLADGRARVEFEEPQRSVTPGQSAVFYDGSLVLGGGVIES